MALPQPTTIEMYIEGLPDERKVVVNKIRDILHQNLPKGFKEELSYNMIGFVVSHDIYPNGYHCNPKLPLPFINVASQKNFVALYHMGIYANPELMEWFVTEYPKYCTTKIDMGKSCIRFKKMDQIPYELIAQLVSKMSPQDWIGLYESQIKKK